ncbi:MAG TPA: FAD:protein FMN transferase [Methylomirabilota bacterium]|jgi:thiamine biosynthesis lipoprotein|nr:FAD:protein FMN transferase [Methylomirabilota bacterium]
MACDVTVLGPTDRPDAGSLAQAVFEDWDRRFSRFRTDSELEWLNEAGARPVAVSKPMLTVVQAALRAARGTDGLFDPLLGARMRELGYDRTYDELPSWRPAAPLAPWRAEAWRDVVVDPDRGTVRLPLGYRLDLGGIAKGMAVDAALDAVVAAGLPFAAVSAGGDLAVSGLPPGQTSWPISIDGLDRTTVALRRGALATSSVLRRRWRTAAGESHHLLDPRSGLPAAGPIVQASVAAATCGQAEVAAKMAILSDLAGAIARLEHNRLAGLLITDQGEAIQVGTWQ